MNRLLISLTIAALFGSTFALAIDDMNTVKKTNTTSYKANDSTSIFYNARTNPDLTEFILRSDRSGLPGMLKTNTNYTIFAPSNVAYSALSAEDQRKWADSVYVGNAMRYLVIPGRRLTTADLMKMDGQNLRTLDGNELTVTVDGNKIMIGKATIAKKELSTATATLYEIDTVILPTAPRSATTDKTTTQPGGTKAK